ncbi:MAG: TolC family protein [Pirellulaceae bacterium]|nr:TolC family protein [Pirellulaceae bacterium]
MNPQLSKQRLDRHKEILLLFVVVLVMLFAGCRSGRSPIGCEYASVRDVARTPWCSPAFDEMQASFEQQQVLAITADPVEEEYLVGTNGEYLDAKNRIWMLEDLIQLALDRNPEISIARHELDQASARVPQAGSLDDPMVNLIGWPIYPNVPQTVAGRMTYDVSVSQEIPWFGKRRARVGEMSREVAAAERQLAANELQVMNEVKQAYFAWWLAAETQEIIMQEIELLGSLKQAVEARYRTGNAKQQDILRLESEIGLSRAELAQATADQSRALADLARAVRWDAVRPPELEQRIPSIELPGDWTSISEFILAMRPELQQAWINVQRDQWKTEQARLDYYPDLTFMVGWGDMTTRRAMSPIADGIGNITTGVSFNLPVRYGRLDAAVRESESQVLASVYEWDRLRQETLRDIEERRAEITGLYESLETYRSEIIPKMEQALDVTIQSYQVNQADFIDLITIRRELVRLRLGERRLQTQYHQSLAELYRLAQ